MKLNFSVSFLSLLVFAGCSGSTFGGSKSPETRKVIPKTTVSQDSANALPKAEKSDASKDIKSPPSDSKKSEGLPTKEDVIKGVVKNYVARDKCTQIAWELRATQGIANLGYGLIHDCVVNKDGTDIVASEQSRKIGTADGEAFYTGYSGTPNGKELVRLLGKVIEADCKLPSGLMTEFAVKMQMTCAVYGKTNGYIVKSMVTGNECKAWVFEGITTAEGCLKRCTQYSQPRGEETLSDGTSTTHYLSSNFSPDTHCQFLESDVPGFVKPLPPTK